MNRFLVSLILILALFSNVCFVRVAIALENARDTKNAVVSHHNQKKTLFDKSIISEWHRHKQAKRRATTKYLKKKMSDVSRIRAGMITKIVVTGNKNVKTEKIKSVIKPYFGKKITRREANLISSDVENYYHKQGYFLPVAHVVMKGSILKIKIIEGKLKTVLIVFDDEKRDKRVMKNERFLDLVTKIEKANPLKTKDLEGWLFLINKIHGYTVEYELIPLSRIEGNDVADLAIHVKTQKAIATIAANNTGTPDLGEHIFEFSSQIYNVIANDSLILGLGTSDKPKNFQIITAGYLKRLNTYGTSASIFFSRSKDNPRVGSGSKDSISTISKGRLDQYILLRNDYSFKLEVAAEKRNVKHYSQTIKTSDYNYTMGSIGGKIKIVDKLNVENWFFPYFNWVLNKVSYKEDSVEKRNFDRDFNYFAVDWHRNQPLPKNFSLFLKASYQYSGKLLPREHRYSINAGNTARGYNSGLVSSDQGISGAAEFRYNKEFDNKTIKKFLQMAQIFGFYDITHFIDHNKDASQRQHLGAIYFDKSTLPALGFGMRFFLAHEFFAEGTAEYPTVKNIMVNGIREKNKPIYRFLISKEFNW